MSQRAYRRDLPIRLKVPADAGRPHRFVVVYDRRLARMPEVRDWLERFPLRYPVSAGEGLKSADRFPRHARRLLAMVPDATRANTTLVGLGGGSVGDFTGFAASVLKRGVGLIHLPTTWLAAIDSAHGGKTALNVDGVKNQLGSFYPADAVVTARSILETLSPTDTLSGLGELIKISVIAGGRLFDGLSTNLPVSPARMWRLLPLAVDAKLRVVDSDPMERSGARRVLNLGHSLGHVLEAHAGLAHGIAVALGLRFAIEWSVERGRLGRDEADRILELLDGEARFRMSSVRGRRLSASLQNLFGALTNFQGSQSNSGR